MQDKFAKREGKNLFNTLYTAMDNRTPITILHIDDDEVFLTVTKDFMEKISKGEVKVDSLQDPNQTFVKLKEKTYDAIIADYQMPSMDGLQLLEQLRAQNISIPFIMLTGRGREKIAIRALNLGANRYIKKGMDTESQYRQLFHAIKEVVEHKRIQTALQESEHRLDLALKAADIGLWDRDIQTGKVVRNERSAQIYGYSLNEIEQSIRWWESRIHPEDRPRVIEQRNKHLQGLTPHYQAVYRLRHRTGEWKWAMSRGKVVKRDKDGNALRITGTLLDITETKKMEEALRRERDRAQEYLNIVGVMVVALTETGEISLINQKGCQILGYKEEELLGKNWFNICIPSRLRKNIREVYLQILSGDLDPVEHYENLIVTKNGEEKLIKWRNTYLSDEKGTIVGSLSSGTDITDQKQTTIHLQESENRLKVILNSLPSGVMLIDAQTHKVVDINPTAIKMIGVPKAQLIGEKCHKFICPAEECQCPITDLGEEIDNSERILLRANGEKVPILKTVRVITLEEREVLLESFIDNSERKKIEEALRESEKQFRTIFTDSPVAIELFDWNGKLIDLNQSCMELFGVVDKNDTYGFDLFTDPNVKEEYKEQLQHGRAIQYQAEFDFNKVKANNLYKTTKTGVIHLDVFITPLSQRKDAPFGYLVSVFDITLQKQAEKALLEKEQRYNSLFGRTNDAVLLVDLDGITLEVNQQAANLLDYEQHELINMHYKHFIAEKEYQQSEIILEKLLKGEKPPIYQRIFRKKDGTEFPAEIDISLVFDIQGNPQYTYSVVRDVSVRIREETEKKHLLEELRQTNASLEEFASIVSHDLKAPLRGVNTLADLLLKDYDTKLDADGHELLGLLKEQVMHMDTLISGILNYSRIGRVEEEREKINIDMLLDEVVGILAPLKHIKIQKQTNLPCIMGEKIHIFQIFENLLSNAIKFIDKSEGLIQVGCEEKADHWQFNITDNGRGIPEKHYLRIFQMFLTLNPTEDTESTGMGLAITKKIVELYGGKVWVESQVGEGSTFFFTLPKPN